MFFAVTGKKNFDKYGFETDVKNISTNRMKGDRHAIYRHGRAGRSGSAPVKGRRPTATPGKRGADSGGGRRRKSPRYISAPGNLPAAAAHRLMESSAPIGKIVLTIEN
jgi:hypothetical protein